MKPIAILGCGPAGMMAAHACAIIGRPFVIFSRPEKSRLGGAQFLHKPITGLSEDEPDATITYRVRGDALTYREKVYGDDETVPFVSFSGVTDGQRQDAWNLIKTYDKLWDVFGEYVQPTDVTADWLESNIDLFDMVMTTVPLPSICLSRARKDPDQPWHRFTVQTIKIHPAALEPIPRNTVLYEGTDDRTWYRSSNLFGVGGTEWSDSATLPPISPFFTDHKPIKTDCDCWDERVVRLGRRGTWTKGVLTHQAFTGALEALVPELKEVYG